MPELVCRRIDGVYNRSEGDVLSMVFIWPTKNMKPYGCAYIIEYFLDEISWELWALTMEYICLQAELQEEFCYGGEKNGRTAVVHMKKYALSTHQRWWCAVGVFSDTHS